MLAVLVMDLVISKAAPRSVAPIVRKIWSRVCDSQPKGVSVDGKSFVIQGNLGFKDIDIATGKVAGSKNGATFNFYLGDAKLGKLIGDGHREIRLIFDSPTFRLAWSTPNGRPSVPPTLVECRPNSTEVLYSHAFTSRFLSIGGVLNSHDPGKDLIVWRGAGNVDESDVVSCQMLLPHLKPSPINFALVYDASRPHKVLGEPMPNGMSWQEYCSYTQGPPRSGLECGDAITGRILWQNKAFNEAVWVGDQYVLAKAGGHWSLLDGNTGKVAISTIPNLNYRSQIGSSVYVSGPYYLTVSTKDGGKGSLITCFRVRQT